MNQQLTGINYKKFKRVTIPLGKDNLLIFGKTCSGKTQLLWAYILYFLAYNLSSENKIVHNLVKDVPKLLSNNFNKFRIWNSFIRQISKNKIHGTAEFRSHINVNCELIFKIRANGSMEINKVLGKALGNIDFGHMGTSYLFTHENEVDNYISSFGQSLREKFARLCEKSFEEIKVILRILFPNFIDILKEHPDIYILGKLYDNEENDNEEDDNEEDDFSVIEYGADEKFFSDDEDEYKEEFPDQDKEDLTRTELMVQSASFQKVFATLVLFFTLFECNNNATDKYFIVDEPDVLLDKQTARVFVDQLLSLSSKHGIKLIITSSNKNIMKMFKEQDIFLLK